MVLSHKNLLLGSFLQVLGYHKSLAGRGPEFGLFSFHTQWGNYPLDETIYSTFTVVVCFVIVIQFDISPGRDHSELIKMINFSRSSLAVIEIKVNCSLHRKSKTFLGCQIVHALDGYVQCCVRLRIDLHALGLR